ncbi:MAG: S1C family serine protease [Planctomycetaceae bacterium]
MQWLARSIRRGAGQLGIAGLLTFGIILAAPLPVGAQTTEVRKPDTSRLDHPPLAPLPDALLKNVPETVADLQQIEDQVQSVVRKLLECTVGLRVGPAQGSGVLVSADGFILTAAHVSGPPGRRIEIALADGTITIGRTLGRSRFFDASLIKIDESQRTWPFAPMGDFRAVHNGDWCLVTGHPGGYQPDRPPVLRLGRVVQIADRLIQTDCELVGGDSGGPVFDMHGQVIGINSRIGENTSLNLHVPVNVYAKNWDRLVASETFGDQTRAFLGVGGESADGGVKLTRVHEHQPAEAAGIQVGDVLLTFQGVPVQSIEELQELVGNEDPGQPVRITLRRDGKIVELAVPLGSREE